MARITLRQLLDHAAENDYGLPAYNINNMEQGLAIMEAAHEVNAPVIIQASRGARNYANDIVLAKLIDALAELLQHDPQAAFARVRDAAQAGQVDAQLLLAQMHMEGKGTAQDASAALLWYETAANNGAPMAMNMLGRCHELGQGTVADPMLAAVWYRRAADTGLDTCAKHTLYE